MQYNWQDVAALFTVLAAAGYLARMAWCRLHVRRGNACGGCAKCAADRPEAGPVQIQPLQGLRRS